MAIFNLSNLTNVISVSINDSVILESIDHVSGIKNISVYSNASFQSYNLTLNGTLLSDSSNPILYSSGRWNFTAWNVIQGIHESGNSTSAQVNDSNYLDVNGELVTGQYLIDLPFQFQELDIIDDFNYIENLTIYLKYNVTDNAGDTTGVLNDFSFQQWNESTSSWINIEDLDARGEYIRAYYYDSSNLSNILIDSLRRPYLTHQFRFQGYDLSPNNLDVRLFYFWIDYNTNRTLDGVDYRLIDVYSLNSSEHVDGTYNLSSTVVDFSNNVYNDWKWIIIDNTEPVIENINIIPVTQLNNSFPITINTSYQEINLNNSYGYYLNQFNVPIYIDNYLNTNFNYTDYFANGSYNFYFYVLDNAGNSAFKNITFQVQDTIQVDYFLSLEINKDRVIIDYWSNMTSYSLFYIDDELEINQTGNSSFYTYIDKLERGTHTLVLEIYDPYSNLYKIDTKHFYITVNETSDDGNGDGDDAGDGFFPLFLQAAGPNTIAIILLISIPPVAISYYVYRRGKRKGKRKKKKKKR